MGGNKKGGSYRPKFRKGAAPNGEDKSRTPSPTPNRTRRQNGSWCCTKSIAFVFVGVMMTAAAIIHGNKELQIQIDTFLRQHVDPATLDSVYINALHYKDFAVTKGKEAMHQTEELARKYLYKEDMQREVEDQIQEEEEKKKELEEEIERQQKEEMKRKEEKKKKEEEERMKKKEEQRLIWEAEERKKAEQKRIEEEEKKRKEAEERQRAEQRKKDEDERKKREAEERQRAEQRKKEEEERKKREAEERQRAEQRKKEDEERKKIEAEEKKKAEQKKREEEERKKREEEERQRAEQRRKDQEKKKREEEERQRAEQVRKEEEAKKKKEEEERQKAEQKRKEEEAKKKKEEEERQKAEQKRKEEETKMKKEDEERQKAEQKRKEEETKKKKEEEERQKAEQKRKEEETKKKKKDEERQKAEQKRKEEEEERKRRETEEKSNAEKRKREEEMLKEKERNLKEEKQMDKAKIKEEEEKQKKTSKKTITSNYDYPLRSLLDKADDLLEKNQIDQALDQYNSILSKHPLSPRALHGKALALDKKAEKERSNTVLEESLKLLQSVLNLKDVPDELLITAGKKLAERQLFRGWSSKSANTWKFLTEKFPDRLDFKNQLGVTYLMYNQNEKARQTFQKVLEADNSNGFAKVHVGFIIKTHDNDPAKAIPFLQGGIDSGEEGTKDGRFYFHLGDAYQRTNQTQLAYKVYEDGTRNGLFLSKYQRSLYNVDTLTGRPWWTPQQTGYQKYLKMLEDNWQMIRDEGLKQMDPKSGSFMPEEENLREKGDWKQFTLYARGKKDEKNCARVPKVCDLIDKIPDAKGCTRGQVKYSVMQPGVHVWPHCGPTNCRIRAHLGLKVPPGPKIRVVEETREWKEGKIIIFDDSFEHEVWHDGKEFRLVLIVDFWHPELTERQKRTLSPI